MNEAADRSSAANPSGGAPIATWQAVAALTILVGIGFLVVYLIRHVNDMEPAWSRLVYVYGSLEAASIGAVA